MQIYEATVKRKYLIVVLLTGSSLESPSNNLLNAIPTIPGDICSNACGILKSISCHSNPKEGENSVYEKETVDLDESYVVPMPNSKPKPNPKPPKQK